MGHRQYLPLNHPWKKNKKTFDGNQKLQCAPDVPSRDRILRQLEGMPFGDENANKSNQKVVRTRERCGRRVLPTNNNQRVTMYYGRRKVFSLDCYTGKIIYCSTTLM
jgi:hypothetical protein